MDYERSGLGTVVTTLLAGLTACSNGEHQDYIEGTVIEEFGTVHNQVENNIDQDSISNPNYGIKVRTDSARYVFEIKRTVHEFQDGLYHVHNYNPKSRTLLGLAAAIEPGTRIKFPTNYVGEGNQLSIIKKDNIGKLATDQIDVVRYAHERNREREFAAPD